MRAHDFDPSGDLIPVAVFDGLDTLVHAILGAVVAAVLSFIPLSPVLGGGIAGYLEGGAPRDGMTVGGIAGALLLVPFVVLGTFVLTLLLGVGVGRPTIAVGIVGLLVLVVGALYTVGLGIVGGYLGVYVRNER